MGSSCHQHRASRSGSGKAQNRERRYFAQRGQQVELDLRTGKAHNPRVLPQKSELHWPRRRWLRLCALSLLGVAVDGPLSALAAVPGQLITHGPTSQKRIALTFDDGPGPETPKFLALLEKYRVHATFFLLGELVVLRGATVQQTVRAGHEIASHTYSHINYKAHCKEILAKLALTGGKEPEAEAKARQDLIADMRKTQAVIEKASGTKVTFCRMPNGIDRPWVRAAAKEVGHTLVNWTYGADWNAGSASALLPGYLGALRPGAILLMHDGGRNRAKTLTIAEAVIKEAQARGLAMVTLSELLKGA